MSIRLQRRAIAKTAAYTIKPPQDQPGLSFSNRGAVGSVTFTLPAPGAAVRGWWYEFLIQADQSLIVAAAAAGQIVTPSNAAADNVGFQIASKKIGGRILVVCDGTSWFALGFRNGGGFCVNGGDRDSGVIDMQFSIAGVGNAADTTDDTLFTLALPAKTLTVNGEAVRVRMCGVTAANGNNKRVKIFLGATAVVDSGVVTSNAKNWWAEVVIRRTGAATQLAFGSFGVDGVADVVTKSTPAEDLTTALTLKGTGASPTTGAASDVLGHDWQVELLQF